MSENSNSQGSTEQTATKKRPKPQSFDEANLDVKLLWKDRKRYLGMPISFTRYIVDEDRLTIKVGLFNTRVDDVLLYRILDIKMNQTLGQKMFSVGTITLFTADKSQDMILLRNIKNPEKVRRYLGQLIEQEREDRRLIGRELFGVAGEGGDIDGTLQ